MRRRPRYVVSLVAVAAVIMASSEAASARAPGTPSSEASPDAVSVARARLTADADRGLTTVGDGVGLLSFAGVAAGGHVDDPGVTAAMSVEDAALAHLSHYGAAFGLDRPGTTVSVEQVTHTVAGTDLVRYDQRVGGLRVIGGQLSVSLRPDRSLASVLATTSQATGVAAASVTEQGAQARARAVVAAQDHASDVSAVSAGRWLFDPALLGDQAVVGAHGVWRFDVSGGGVHRTVLVDDVTGAVLLDADADEQLNRVVCDAQDVAAASPTPCTSGFVRTEGQVATGDADTDEAYDLSGVVSDFYQQIGGVDLTNLIGLDVGATKALGSTVHFCYVSTCPDYANAFWDGTQMYYGNGFAVADDVVGHEMTHGVIQHNSNLFYWGQSGAINESIADIMGEIVDHRHPSPGDSPTSWSLGEDLAGYPTGIRNLQDPTLHNQPDRMTSSKYTADNSGYGDNGGVHTDSGVGNKTAYLISQGTAALPGGSFNGQTITGIDGTDPDLTKTATLYLNVIESLTSGSDYAALGSVLDQSCQDLLNAGSAGFTAADCTAVHQAGVATELSTTPTQAPQPPDAPETCPSGTTLRVLLDSETGDPASAFVAGPTWSRAPNANAASNAVSGLDSWYSSDPATVGASSLVAAAGVALPAGQASYLWFQGWRLLDFGNGNFYDGGTVEVDDLATADPPLSTGSGSWINGPGQTIASGYSSPVAGQVAFGADGYGYTASRLDLGYLVGRTVKPQFTMNSDAHAGGGVGWYLDDIRVYTCDPSIANASLPTVSGTPRQGQVLTAHPGGWTPSAGLTFGYQWLRNGVAVTGATHPTYPLTAADAGRRISVRVTATGPSDQATATSAATPAVTGLLTPGLPRVSGRAKVGKLLTVSPGVWKPTGVHFAYQWLRNGKAVAGARSATHKVVAADRGKRLSVRVTGTRSGYVAATRTSAATTKVT